MALAAIPETDKHRLRMQCSAIAARTAEASTRIVLNVGGTRSTKTFSTCQVLISKLLSETDKVFTITRKTHRTLKDSTKKDFIDLLKLYELYDEDRENKSDGTYEINGNLIYFIGVDEASKLKGRSNNYIYMSEADEFDLEDYRQFILRLSRPSNDGRPNQLFMDLNPPDEYHWIFESVYPRIKYHYAAEVPAGFDEPRVPVTINGRGDATLIESTFFDNPFLDDATVLEIVRLRDEDPQAWRVYGLGQVAGKIEKVYPSFKIVKEFPACPYVYGLDWGYNNPQALTKVGRLDKPANEGGGLYWQQIIYRSHLTTPGFITLLAANNVGKKDDIYADPSRPDLIEELRAAGYRIKEAYNPVYEGIMRVKSVPLYIVSAADYGSPDGLKEVKGYKWKVDKNGRILEEPVKFNDHFCDSGRYGSAALVSSRKKIKGVQTTIIKRK